MPNTASVAASVSSSCLCLVWALLGFALLGLGFHLTDPDRAQAALLLAFLVGYGGPAWTVILAHWSADRS